MKYWAAGLWLLLLAVAEPAKSKVVVVGIAQDGGIPHLGCVHEICRAQRHYVSSLVAFGGDSAYLFDATPDLREQHRELVRRYPEAMKRPAFDGIFLTHAHMGHYTGLMFLGKESVSTKKVPVYASEEMCRFLRENEPWKLLVTNENIVLHPFRSGEELQLDSITVTPLPVPHRKEFTDTHGFLIRGASRSVLFVPDIDSWDPIRDSIQAWLQKADYALLDGTFYSGDELPGRDIRLVPHPTIQASTEFLNSLPPFKAQVYFTHLNHTNPLLLPQSRESEAFRKTSYRVAGEWQEFGL